jgi:acyl-CoA oxidase
MEKGYVENGKARAIRAEVNALCAELRPDAVALVDAFAIPDALLPEIARRTLRSES